MGILGYHFSESGLIHKEKNTPCQDYSGILEYGIWKIAVVADGVGTCKHSDIASKRAVEAVLQVIFNCFPNSNKEEDLLSLISIAFHGAANAVEMYVKRVNGEYKDYHTTLALALYNGNDLYYGNAGDSGIIALDEYGEYHALSTKQNNEYDEVFTLANRTFEVGKADFNAVAVLCMTDGLLDWLMPKEQKEAKYPIFVPRANLFIQPEVIWKKEIRNDFFEKFQNAFRDEIFKILKTITNAVEQSKNSVPELENIGNLTDGNLRDDLSIAALINTNANISPEEIQWDAPPEPTPDEIYLNKWKEIKSLHPATARREFRSIVQRWNSSWSEGDVDAYVEHIWKAAGEVEQNGQSKLCEQRGKVNVPQTSLLKEQSDENKIQDGSDDLHESVVLYQEEQAISSETMSKVIGKKVTGRFEMFGGKIMSVFMGEQGCTREKVQSSISDAEKKKHKP